MKRSTSIISAFALALAAYAFFINPLIAAKRSEIREKLESKVLTLEKYERFMKDEKQAESELKEASGALKKAESGISQAPDTSLASAKLQSRMQDMAEKSGLSIVSIKTGSPVVYKGYSGFPMEIEATATMDAVSGLLKSLSGGGEFIKIERLDITAVGPMAEAALRVRMQVMGLSKI